MDAAKDVQPVRAFHVVFAVGYPEQAVRVDSEAVGYVELASLGAFATPALDELAVLVELEDARVAFAGAGSVALGDEDVTVGGVGDVVGLVEEAGSDKLLKWYPNGNA